MTALRLFGLHWEESNGAVTAPNQRGLDFDVSAGLNRSSGLLTLTGTIGIAKRHSVALNIRLNMRRDAAGMWLPTDGEHPQRGDNQEIHGKAGSGLPAFVLDSKLLLFRVDAASSVSAEHGRVLFSARGENLIDGSNLPLSALYTGAGFSLDLSQPALEFVAGAFELRTCIQLEKKTASRRISSKRFYEQIHQSLAHRLPLSEHPDDAEFLFDAPQSTGNTPAILPLHVYQPAGDAKDDAEPNPLVVPLGLSNYALAARFGRDESRTAQLTSLRAVGRGGPQAGERVRLHAYCLAQRLNRPAQFELHDALALHVRVGARRGRNPHRPEQPQQPAATLLIAPGELATQLSRRADAGSPLHGVVPTVRFDPQQNGRLICTPVKGSAESAKGAHRALTGRASLPWLLFEADTQNGPSFQIPKAGDAHLPASSQSGTIETMQFRNGPLALPLLPRECLAGADEFAAFDALNSKLDALLAENSYALVATAHESGLLERPPETAQPLRVQQLLPHAEMPAGSSAPDIQLAAYKVVRDYGKVAVELTIRAGQIPDYVLIDGADPDARFVSPAARPDVDPAELFNWVLGAERRKFLLGGPPAGGFGRPLAILKLSRSITLREIFAREQLGRVVPNTDLDILDDLMEAPLLQRSWVGLVLFSVPLNYQDSALGNLIGNDEHGARRKIDMAYVAISPDKVFGTRSGGFTSSTSARVAWRNTAKPTNPPATFTQANSETWYRFDKLDLRWYDNALVHLHAEARVVFGGLMGAHLNPGVTLHIEGSLDEKTGDFTFRGRLARPLELVPKDWDYGPIEQFSVASANLRSTAEGAFVDLSGSVFWRDFGFFGEDWFSAPANAEMAYVGLTLPITQNAGPSWTELALDYPNLRFPADTVVLELGALKLTLSELAVAWKDQVDPSRYLSLNGDVQLDRALPVTQLTCRLELMKMPELAAHAGTRLTLEFVFAFGFPAANRRRWSADSTRFLLRAAGAEGLRIALLSFLELDVGKAALEIHNTSPDNDPKEDVRWLVLEMIKVKVLGESVIDEMSAYVFTAPDGKSGFLGYLAPGTSDDNEQKDQEAFEKAEKDRVEQSKGKPRKATSRRAKRKKKKKEPSKTPLRVEWGLVAQNMRLAPSFAKKLVSIEADGATVGEDLATAFADDKVVPQKPDDPVADWLFAGGLNVLEGFLVGKFLFQEGAYYGIALQGEVFEKYMGLDLGVSILYIKGSQADEDTFVVSVRVPEIVAPALTFMGGIVTLEVMMNGSFLLDVGFPHLDDEGRRDWDRAFGAIITPFVGKAGVFIRYRSQKRIAGLPGDKELMLLSAGYAAQIGLGGSYGGGAFEVTASIAVYYVLHGDMVIYGEELCGLRMVGAVGVIVKASAELNWWVISASLELTLGAEARATLLWVDGSLGTALLGDGIDRNSLPVPLGELADVPPGGARITLDLTVWAEAEAEACIGAGIFKICASISFSIPMRMSYSFELD